MFEIDNPLSRAEFLNKVGGIEEKIFLKIGDEIIKSIPEKDVDRTSAEGKASSVQFVHFEFTDSQIEKFKDSSNEVIIELIMKCTLTLQNLLMQQKSFSFGFYLK